MWYKHSAQVWILHLPAFDKQRILVSRERKKSRGQEVKKHKNEIRNRSSFNICRDQSQLCFVQSGSGWGKYFFHTTSKPERTSAAPAMGPASHFNGGTGLEPRHGGVRGRGRTVSGRKNSWKLLRHKCGTDSGKRLDRVIDPMTEIFTTKIFAKNRIAPS